MTTIKDLNPNADASIADVEIETHGATYTLRSEDRQALATAVTTAVLNGAIFLNGTDNTATLHRRG